MVEVHYVCKLDKTLYSVVTPDIQSDDVVITEERLAHVEDHHPGDSALLFVYAEKIITEPDYILEGNLPNTAMILKEFTDGDKRFKLILRLRTSLDASGFKNSVITFQVVNSKRYGRYTRNGKILYKREPLSV